MRRITLLRSLTVVALAVSCGVAARAQSAADSDAILKEISQLRDQYRQELDQGHEREANELRGLLRDLNAAAASGDWDRAAEILGKRKAEAEGGGDGGDAADLLAMKYPARKAESKEEDPNPFTVEKQTYEGIGGITLGALVYRLKPPTEENAKPLPGKMPIIVLAHGGFRGVSLSYRRVAEALVKVGYIVFVPEFRGQGQSQGKVEYGGGEVLDLLSAVEAVKELEGGDPGRIGLVGCGHGGLVTLLALARVEGVGCAATISAPTDLARLVRESVMFKRELKLNRVPLRLSDANVLRQRSPLFYVSGIEVPLLLMHGERDVVVPVKFAEGYAAVLEARGKDVTLETYLGADEGLVQKVSTYNVDLQNFLAKRLKPHGWKIIKKKKDNKKRDNRDRRGRQQEDDNRRRRR